MVKKRLIIVHTSQFGKVVDYIKYCEYLSRQYNIVYFCLDEGLPKVNFPNIKIHYTKQRCGYTIALLFFLIKVVLYLGTHKGVVMAAYGSFAILYKIVLPFRKMILNVRSVSVNPDPVIRKKENTKILRTSKFFDRTIMISEEGAKNLGFNMQNTSLVSLGADVISDKIKDFADINLFYVGTLTNRQIIKTIIGLDIFLQENKPECIISYDIVGAGQELSLIQNTIRELELIDIVKIHGQLTYAELKPFFDRCNIGVAFVPQTEYYEFQPPTKTFEYIKSGLYCIATGTYANREIVTEANGIIIDDTPESFAKALKHIYANRKLLKSDAIRESLADHNWEMIIEKQLMPVIENMK